MRAFRAVLAVRRPVRRGIAEGAESNPKIGAGTGSRILLARGVLKYVKEVWAGFRPQAVEYAIEFLAYAARFAIDLLVAASLWVVLFVFEWVTGRLPVGGWAGEFVTHLHSAAIVAGFVIFGLLFVLDIIEIRKARRGGD